MSRPTARIAWAQYISLANSSIAFSRIISGVTITPILLLIMTTCYTGQVLDINEDKLFGGGV